MEYRYIATSVEGFVQQLASNLLPHGYWFYVQGRVAEGKSADELDAKLLDKYGVRLSRQARARRKLAGSANLHYLRHERDWVLLASHGEHPFFAAEAQNIRDVRKAPIHFEGYSISVKQGGFIRRVADEPRSPDGKLRVRVQIGRERYRELCAYLLEEATRSSADELARQLFLVPFEPYAPVRKQLLKVLRLVNKKRQTAGLSKIGTDVLRYRREIVRPFSSDRSALAA